MVPVAGSPRCVGYYWGTRRRVVIFPTETSTAHRSVQAGTMAGTSRRDGRGSREAWRGESSHVERQPTIPPAPRETGPSRPDLACGRRSEEPSEQMRGGSHAVTRPVSQAAPASGRDGVKMNEPLRARALPRWARLRQTAKHQGEGRREQPRPHVPGRKPLRRLTHRVGAPSRPAGRCSLRSGSSGEGNGITRGSPAVLDISGVGRDTGRRCEPWGPGRTAPVPRPRSSSLGRGHFLHGQCFMCALGRRPSPEGGRGLHGGRPTCTHVSLQQHGLFNASL